MTLSAGTQIGQYVVRGPLGSGGMGEVYRARDTKLGREVAMKILPEAFTTDPDRLARFEREARILASLNHPHIATIYGVEESAGVQALVLELVEGLTLADRLHNGPLSISEALLIARQIADALDAAHEKGIIHRDLKPANIKITPDGVVKVLDFGLAKAAADDETPPDATQSPTMMAANTRVGVILGTAAYMSPEQARGWSVDKRTDIWAFGCVLYEMLTGRAVFQGETVSDTIAATLEREPDWQAVSPSTPDRVRDLLRRCLQKEPKQRLRDVGDAVNAIVDVLSAPSLNTARTIPERRRASWHWPSFVTGALILGGLATGGLVWIANPWAASPRARNVQFVVTAGEADALETSGVDRDLAISPDGTKLVYVSGGPGRGRIVTRALDALTTQLLWDRGTPRTPFFSPDGQWVGFSEVFGGLRKISITGGPVTDVVRSVEAIRGATWGTEDRIIFATSNPATGLLRVSAQGGEPEILTRPDGAKGELDHFWPEILPGGENALFTIVSAGSIDTAQIAVVDLASGVQKVLIRGGTHAQYVPTGHLIYGAAGSLQAVPFDVKRLEVTGESVKILDRVAITPDGAVNMTVSQDGTMAYVRVGTHQTDRTLVWVQRDGREDPIAAPPRPYIYPRLSPDRTRVALEVWDQNRDIWVWDLARETLTRVTDTPGRDGFPVWTPDSRRLIFGSTRGSSTSLFWRAADVTGSAARLTETQKIQFPYSVSPDGRQLVFREDDPKTGLDIAFGSLADRVTAAPLIRTPSNELNAEISPDGRWLAYQSNESGQDEIYVVSFPDVSRSRSQVSAAGGTRPLWARNGRELFYLGPDGLNGVTIAAGASFQASRPNRLLEKRYFAETAFIGRTYDVSADGQRFLMIKHGGTSPGSGDQNNIVVVQGWSEELKRAAPAK